MGYTTPKNGRQVPVVKPLNDTVPQVKLDARVKK